MRREMFIKNNHGLQDFFTTLEQSAGLSSIDQIEKVLGGIPQDAFLNLLFSLGAVNLRNSVHQLLHTASLRGDIDGLAYFSMLRHSLLESNAELAFT